MSPVADFPAATTDAYEAMATIAELAAPLLPARRERPDHRACRRGRAAGRVSVRDYLDSRPLGGRDRGDRAGDRAGGRHRLPAAHRARLDGPRRRPRRRGPRPRDRRHLRGHRPPPAARRRGRRRLGAVAKCAPPLRRRPRPRRCGRARRRRRVVRRLDHSPSTPELREGDAFASWGGIAGCQSTLELLLTEGRLTLPELAEGSPARSRAFSLPGKGSLAPGNDADLVLVKLGDAACWTPTSSLPPPHEPVRRP